MEVRGKLLRLLLLLALAASWVIFNHSVLVLQNCVMAIASFILLVTIPILSFGIAQRQFKERSKVAGILESSLTLIVGLVMVVVILYVVITNRQPEIPRFLLACIFGKSPQDNGILALSTLAITLIAIVFFAIMTLYGALSLKKLIFSKKLT